MRTIVHLSDLHFGTETAAVVDGVVETVHRIAPDYVAVSGDLTQRARSREFRAARAFLDRLPGQRIVVPGNHDVPLHNVFARLFEPLSKYRRYIDDSHLPMVVDEEVLIVGATSARSMTIAGGRLSRRTVADLAHRLSGMPEAPVRVLVCHHPIDPAGRRGFAGSIDHHVALPEIGSLGVDVLLSGHLHGPASHVAEVVRADSRHTLLMVGAGTATSTRLRHEAPNSFNVLRIEPRRIRVERLDWSVADGGFAEKAAQSFHRQGEGRWAPAPMGLDSTPGDPPR